MTKNFQSGIGALKKQYRRTNFSLFAFSFVSKNVNSNQETLPIFTRIKI